LPHSIGGFGSWFFVNYLWACHRLSITSQVVEACGKRSCWLQDDWEVKRSGQNPTIPFKGTIPYDLKTSKWPHSLKVLPSPNSAIGTSPLTDGLLGNSYLSHSSHLNSFLQWITESFIIPYELKQNYPHIYIIRRGIIRTVKGYYQKTLQEYWKLFLLEQKKQKKIQSKSALFMDLLYMVLTKHGQKKSKKFQKQKVLIPTHG
jgi:hypothetical protein